jgi:carbamoyltransferase
MGLAAYGTPREELVRMVEVGRHDYRVRLDRVEGLVRRVRYSGEPTRAQQDLAASLQAALERAAIEMADCLHDATGLRDLCLAGGVALNCSMNGALLRTPLVERIYVQPAASDAGTALGAAYQLCWEEGIQVRPLDTAALGPEYGDEEVDAALEAEGLRSERVDDPAAVAAELVASGEVIGWFQGRMEFGPRALGQRSILADPTDPSMHDRVNRLKRREMWRPLAPSVLLEREADWFEFAAPSPFMNVSLPVREERRAAVPAVTHVDGTARLQTVEERVLPLYHELISRFAARGKPPIVMNTSFNSRGQPIVRTPLDAARTFKRLGLDALVIGRRLVRRARP